MLFMHRLI